MKTSDIGCSIFLMALGGFTAWHSEKLSIGGLRAPGPGFFPFCLGLLLIGLAALIFFQGLKQGPGVREKGRRRSRVILALAAVFAYPFVLDPAGYIVSTFFLMVILMGMMVKKTWWFAPALSGLISLASYILFKVWLQVLLPVGILGF
jgi:putative tricarboxylic transport membrane protein